MSRIVIKDLPDNVELDQEALRSVVGGSRSSSGGAVKATSLRNNKPQSLWGTLAKSKPASLR